MAYTFTNGEVGTAAKLNTLLPPIICQAGVVKMTPIANTPTSKTITFPVPYASPPRVIPTAYSTAVGELVKGVSVTDVTATGCTLWVYRTNTTNTTLAWQAWGSPPSAFVDGSPVAASALNAAGASPLRTKSGRDFITPSSANTPTSKTISFPTDFAATPTVVIALDTTVPGTALMAGVTGVTASGFKAWVCRTNTTSTYFQWIALGRP